MLTGRYARLARAFPVSDDYYRNYCSSIERWAAAYGEQLCCPHWRYGGVLDALPVIGSGTVLLPWALFVY